MSAVGALLARIVDYAGLFPPASLDMERAVANYQSYLIAEHSWMLGNFVVPANRLGEFAEVFSRVCCNEQEQPWTLSVVCGSTTTGDDLKEIEEFQQGAAFISTVEARAAEVRSARSLLRRMPAGPARYVEFPSERAKRLLPVLASCKARAKLRTGGTSPEAIPKPEAVARFLQSCADSHIPFKATAGMHHAVRGSHHLTYDLSSPIAQTHGFLNFFLGAGLAWLGTGETAVVKTLKEEDPGAFRLEEDSISWHDQSLTAAQVAHFRADLAISFGSCSFAEPIEDLKAMEWL